MDEKIRCEAASFAWIAQNCPEVPIPRLWGFGLPNASTFSSTPRLPWHLRVVEYIERSWAWILRQPFYGPFVPLRGRTSLKSGYLLMEYIGEKQGTMLSNIWPLRAEAIDQKRNLYRSLSKVMLALARPMARIGSFTVDDRGEVSLSHRPLTLRVAALENEGIPMQMSPQTRYSTTGSYILDLLRYQDLKLQYQPNAVRSALDAEGQMAVLTIMRSMSPYFTRQDLERGPFVLRLTDLHPSNIFVDQHCNITAVIDLEWSCALPNETKHPPFWLSGHELDDLEGEKKADFDWMCVEFLNVFEEEDMLATRHGLLKPGFCTAVMKKALNKNAHWYWSCLNEPRGMYNLFLEHIQPLLAPSHSRGEPAILFQKIVTPYWCPGASGFIDSKLRQRDDYLKQLRAKRAEYPNAWP